MSNVLGSSNNNRQAPPPPPLPEGMRAVGVARGANSAKAAPPPPPLPEGMRAVGGAGSANSAKAAPPPPPLPNGMKPAGAGNPVARKAAPPPPPLPNDMKSSQAATANSKQAGQGLGQGASRNTMSLSSAVMEKEQEKEQEEENARAIRMVPKAYINGGEIVEGDTCFGRSPLDGLYYFATLTGFDQNSARVTFFDEAEADLPFDKLFTVEEIIKHMQCFANYSGRGNYFPATIDKFTDEAVTVRYDEDSSITEELDISKLRFAVR